MEYTLNIKGRLLSLSRPQVMGILNVTPDSFYADSRKQTEQDIVDRAHQIIHEGGSIIDVGACSTRPGSQPVSASEESSRLQWALGIIRRELPDTPISVDTFRPSVARQCIEEWGADIINDISEGGLARPDGTPAEEGESMFELVGRLQVPYILMSTKSNLKDMIKTFSGEIQQLRDLGAKDIILDPGYGFGKSLADNYRILYHAEELQVLDLPILVGASRKSMIFKLIGGDASTSLNGTTVIDTVSLMKGASILRVHDVRQAVEAVDMLNVPV